jgi:prophage antirepressor-like protein
MKTTSQNQLAIFNFKGSNFRTLSRNGIPWFIADDICLRFFKITETRDIVSSLPEDERGVTSAGGFTRHKFRLVINENGIFRLLSKSRRAHAREFIVWVRTKVIPDVKEWEEIATGRSPLSQLEILEKQIKNVDFLIRNLMK